jgi:hypothetical protein
MGIFKFKWVYSKYEWVYSNLNGYRYIQNMNGYIQNMNGYRYIQYMNGYIQYMNGFFLKVLGFKGFMY